MENINIVRKIRLSKLGCYNFKSVKEKEMFDYVEHNLLGLKLVELEEYSEYVYFFNKEDKCVFRYNPSDKLFLIRYHFVWEVFANKFKYSYQSYQRYQKTKEFFQSIIEYVYKIKDVEIDVDPLDNKYNIEQAYKIVKNSLTNGT